MRVSQGTSSQGGADFEIFEKIKGVKTDWI
jgi:hypothetical protein